MGIKKQHVPGCTCCGDAYCPEGVTNHTYTFDSDPFSSSLWTTGRCASLGGVSDAFVWDSSNSRIKTNPSPTDIDSVFSYTGYGQFQAKIPSAATFFSIEADVTWNNLVNNFHIAVGYARTFRCLVAAGLLQATNNTDGCDLGTDNTALSSGIASSGSATMKMEFTDNGSDYTIEYFWNGSSLASETKTLAYGSFRTRSTSECISCNAHHSWPIGSAAVFTVDNVAWVTS